MTDHTDLVAYAKRVLEDMRSHTDQLDESDESLWFIQAILASMAKDPGAHDGAGASDRLAYAIYISELLVSSCDGVHVEIAAVGDRVTDVDAVRDDGTRQHVLSWIQQCVEDPNADNIVFKFAGPGRTSPQGRRLSEHGTIT